MDNYEYEKRIIQIRTNDEQIIQGELSLCEFIRDDKDWCSVVLSISEKIYESSEQHFFTALQRIREQLESEKLQILCNGAARNVYPSAMMFDMGSAGIAFKMQLNKCTQKSDIIDIFDYDASFEFVTVAEQEKFFAEWIHSNKDQ